jgi:hypothetical protein
MEAAETLSTRAIVDRLARNALANGETADYLRALADVQHYDDLHSPRRTTAPAEGRPS